MTSPVKGTTPTLTIPKALDVPVQSPGRAIHDLIAWLSNHWPDIAIAVGAGILIYFALNLLRGVGRKLFEREMGGVFGTVAGRGIAKTSQLFMALVAAKLVMGYANPPGWLSGTIRFLFTIVATFQVAIWIREVVLGLIERHTDAETGHETLSNAVGIIRILISVALFSIALVVVLDNIGVNVTGLVAGLGIGGIAIGLAAQGIFSDLFAALSIILDKPFKQGEVITYDQTTARVERIGLKSTRLRALSGERKVISNANLLQKEITGLQHLARRRVKFAMGLVYHTAPEMAERVPPILKAIVEEAGHIFVSAGMVNFGASTLDYELYFDVENPDGSDYFMCRHQVAMGILKRFKAEGIQFAFPTQTTMTAAPDGQYVMPYATTTSVDA
jgi:small-conductance mechanosensitive channel